MSMTIVKSPATSRSLKLTAVMILAALMATFAAVFGASTTAFANEDSQARETLIITVTTKLGSNEYEMEGGGFMNGSQLVDDDGNINKQNYEKLNSKGRDKLTSDIMTYSQEKVDKDESEGTTGSGTVTQETYSNWLKDLQQTKGFGSKVLNETLKQTGPDFVTANQMFAPFSGLIGTVMGFGAIVIMALLGIVIVMDIAYITIPPVRLVVGDSDSKGGQAASKLISYAAISAVQEEEGGGGGDGGSKSALGQYFKKRVISMVVLGICLVYLIQGQIWVAIGWLLDAVGGFLGF